MSCWYHCSGTSASGHHVSKQHGLYRSKQFRQLSFLAEGTDVAAWLGSLRNGFIQSSGLQDFAGSVVLDLISLNGHSVSTILFEIKSFHHLKSAPPYSFPRPNDLVQFSIPRRCRPRSQSSTVRDSSICHSAPIVDSIDRSTRGESAVWNTI